MKKIEMDTFQAQSLSRRVKAHAWDSEVYVQTDEGVKRFTVGKLNNLINRADGPEVSIKG